MDQQFIKRFIKGTAATSFGTAASILCHVLSIMILTRYLPKNEYGIFILIMVIVHFFNILSGVGLNLTLVKFISSEKDGGKKDILTPVMILRFIAVAIISVIFYAIGSSILPLFDRGIADFLLYIPVLFFLTSFKDLFYNLLQGLNLFKKYAIVQVVPAVVRMSAILGILSLNQVSLRNLIYIEIFVMLLSIGVQVSVIPLKTFKPWRYSKVPFREMIRFSSPLYLNNILGFIIDRVNIVIIGLYLAPASIAYYDVAQKIPETLMRMFQSFVIVYFPNSSKLFSQGNRKNAQKLMNKTLAWFSIGMSFLVLASFLFQREIVELIFSDHYLQSSVAFSLLMLNFHLRASSNIMGYSLVSAGYSTVPVKANSISSSISIIGSLLLIPVFGFIGAVYSLLIMGIISNLIYYRYLVKAGVFPDFKNYLTPLIVIAGIIGSYYLLGQQSAIIKLLFLILYGVIIRLVMPEFRNMIRTLYRIRRREPIGLSGSSQLPDFKSGLRQ